MEYFKPRQTDLLLTQCVAEEAQLHLPERRGSSVADHTHSSTVAGRGTLARPPHEQSPCSTKVSLPEAPPTERDHTHCHTHLSPPANLLYQSLNTPLSLLTRLDMLVTTATQLPGNTDTRVNKLFLKLSVKQLNTHRELTWKIIVYCSLVLTP